MNFLKIFHFLVIFPSIFALIIDIPNQGTIRGVKISKLRIQKIFAFYGIPYAQPPLGPLRFAPPVNNPLPSWKGMRFNSDYLPSCLQSKEAYKESELPFLQLLSETEFLPSNISENCLYLNVFVPETPAPPKGFATIVWIHPGNFKTGIPSIWDPHTLVYRHNVIVVTFAWRLNIMGFFTTMDGEATGNYGLMDQQAAMEWVRNNIQHFRGNKENIVLMGYGAGATSIGIHLISPSSRFLFDKVIVMSPGSLFHPSAVKYPGEDEPVLNRLSKEFGCLRKPTSLLLDCLRRADARSLVQQTSSVNWRPSIDKNLNNYTADFLPELPKYFFDRGEFAKVPLMTGYNFYQKGLDLGEFYTSKTDSFRQILTDIVVADLPNVNDSDTTCSDINYDYIIDSVAFVYGPVYSSYEKGDLRSIATRMLGDKIYGSSAVKLASYFAEAEAPTYVYRFDSRPISPLANKNLPERMKSYLEETPHLFDLAFVWGVPYWNADEWNSEDKKRSEIVMLFWTNFAKMTNPNWNSVYPLNWEPFEKDKPLLMLFLPNIGMSSLNVSNENFVFLKHLEFWYDFYPKVVAVATECCALANGGISIEINKVVFIFVAFQLIYLFY